MSCNCNCRSFLQIESLTTTGTVFNINIAPQTLIDGFFYTLRLNQAFPTLTGKEDVFIVNGTQNIQLTDWRGRALLSERVLRFGERLRGVYTENGIGGLPVFVVLEGICPIRP